MGKDPAFPFYVNDWLSSPHVQRMNLAEQGAYIRLLCFCWSSGDCSLPEDGDELMQMAGLPIPIGIGNPEDIAEGKLDRCETTHWDLILDCFIAHPLHSHKLTNAKLMTIWTERQEWRKERSKSGKKGAESRWGKYSDKKRLRKDGLANAKPMAKNSSSSSSSSSSSPSIKTPPISPKGDLAATDGYTANFTAFWKFVPPHKSKNKGAAAKAYAKHAAGLKARFPDPHAWLCEQAAAYYASDVGKTQWALSPAPWLNQGGYDDDPESWRRKEEPSGRPEETRAQAYDPDRPIGPL